jgi:hypothetical protein
MAAASSFRRASEVGEVPSEEVVPPATEKNKEKEKKSFSRLPRFKPKLSAYGLRPITHKSFTNKRM